MTRLGLGTESSTRPLLAPLDAPEDGKVSINSFEKKEYNDTDGERRRLLTRTDSDGLDEVGSQSHQQTFETCGDVSHYQPVEQYEGRHRYDPKFEWKPKEERKLVRKVRNCNLDSNFQKGSLMPTGAVGQADMFLGVFDVFRAPA